MEIPRLLPDFYPCARKYAVRPRFTVDMLAPECGDSAGVEVTTLATAGRSRPNPATAIFDQQLADGTITQDRYDEIMRGLGVD